MKKKKTKISYFYTLNPFICYLRVFPQKVLFQKRFILARLTETLLTCFLFLFPFILNFFSHCAKFHDFSMKSHGETIVQSWTFWALFHLPHSAVHINSNDWYELDWSNVSSLLCFARYCFCQIFLGQNWRWKRSSWWGCIAERIGRLQTDT